MDLDSDAERLLALTLERPAAERSAFLAAVCGSAELLRRELSLLLPFAEGVSSFPGNSVAWSAQSKRERLLGESGLPAHIGEYRIVRLLGYGSMGTVYEARQIHPERAVALKLLGGGPLVPGLWPRFAEEAALLRRLDHPGFPRLLAVGVHETSDSRGTVFPFPFLVMELVQGERLDRYAARPDLSLRDCLAVFAAICDAVHHAHEQGVVHRDLKPANILVAEDGRPKIVDFGIARAVDGDLDATRLTATGQILGSLAYMSPEQLRDSCRVDARADVYALGVTLYEVATGRLPYAVGRSALASAPSRLHKQVLPRGLAVLIRKAMARDRERRYRSAAELGAAVRRLLSRQPSA